jgi:hypothetical protein
MGLFGGDRDTAGRSATNIYKGRYRIWRNRTRLVALLAILPILSLAAALSLGWPAHRGFYLGLGIGSAMTLVVAVGLAAPEHVDRWRRGAGGERRTAKELFRPTKEGWIVVQDLPDGTGRNRDHVVIAPSGQVFLLDTKSPGGTISVQRGVLEVNWLEDPDDGYSRDLTPSMKAAAARLAEDLGASLGRRPWVTPMVVIWGRWDGAPHMHDGVAWVHGRVLAERLAAHAGEPNQEAQERVAHALRSLSDRANGRQSEVARPATGS